MQVHNLSKNTIVMHDAILANTFFTRLKGLLAHDSLREGEGLILEGVKSIHTLFMRFPIDVIYLDNQKKVIKLDSNMSPFRLGTFVLKSAYVLELPVGGIAASNTSIDDQITFKT